jgi:hypothetical protein
VRPLILAQVDTKGLSSLLELLAIPPPRFFGTTPIFLEQLVNALVNRWMTISKPCPSSNQYFDDLDVNINVP